jgi:hypothetical protein
MLFDLGKPALFVSGIALLLGKHLAVKFASQGVEVDVIGGSMSAQARPLLSNLSGPTCMQRLGFSGILGPERELLFPFAKNRTQVNWDRLAKPVHSGAGMLPRTRHLQDHFVPLPCTNGALQKSLFLRNTRQ